MTLLCSSLCGFSTHALSKIMASYKRLFSMHLTAVAEDKGASSLIETMRFQVSLLLWSMWSSKQCLLTLFSSSHWKEYTLSQQ